MFYGAISFDKDISSWNVAAVAIWGMDDMFEVATSLSDCNKALMYASFAAQTSEWPYSWNSLRALPRRGRTQAVTIPLRSHQATWDPGV